MPSETLILFPPFRLDVRNAQLWRDNTLLPVRPKPFAILAYLAEHPGRLVPAAELRQAVWPQTYVSEGLLRGYIREVRTVLGDNPEAPRFVETIPRRGYRFVAAVTTAPVPSAEFQSLGAVSAPAATPQPVLSTLVGRDTELAQMQGWLATALQGRRQVVFVTGEPGIGKTTLVDSFLSGIRRREGEIEEPKRQKAKRDDSSLALSPQLPAPVLIGRGQCIEHYGAGEAYLPVLEAVGQLCRQPRGEQVIALLSRYAPTWLVQMPALVSDAVMETLQRKVQGATRERMLREMAEALEALTAAQPLVLLLEDLHWSDYSTLDLLTALARRQGPARLLLLGTYRSAEVVVSGHPLKALKQELQVHGQCEELPLGFLTATEVTQYLAVRFGRQGFPSELGRVLHQSTEGNPLFMANVVDSWVRQGVLAATTGHWQLTTKVEDLAAGVPESLRQLIKKQLERLTPEEQRVVETASVIGGEFSAATVAASLDEPREHVERWCEGLVEREQFLRVRGTETLADGVVTGRYGFLHALYPQVLYEQLAAVRRVQLHRRIGDWEEAASGTRVSEIAAELAMHFERGQDYPRAVQYLTQAADTARRRHAYREEISLLTRALEILKLLPNTSERVQHELALLITLGVPLLTTRGYAAPEVQQTYAQARKYCQRLGESPQLLPALGGLFRFYLVRAELQMAGEVAEQMLRLAEQTSDTTMFLVAHSVLGVLCLCRGELVTAHRHLTAALALYNPEHHSFLGTLHGDDPGVTSHCFAALALWFLGYPDQAVKEAQHGLSLAQSLAFPYGVVFAQDLLAWIHLYRGETRAAQAWSEALQPVAIERGFQFLLADNQVLYGMVVAEQSQEAEGFAEIQAGVSAYQATGARMSLPSQLALLARAQGAAGRVTEGLAVLEEALAIANETQERSVEAELWRLKGELILQQSRSQRRGPRIKKSARFNLQSSQLTNPESRPLAPAPESAAETYFLKAISIARQQQAKSWELRATMSLLRLRQQQVLEQGAMSREHKVRTALAEAHEMLSAVYGWFTEGFDTRDLQEAKALVDTRV